MSLEAWKSEHGPASGRTQANSPMDASMTTLPLLAEVCELAEDDAKEVLSPPSNPATRPLVVDLCELMPMPTTTSGDEGSSGASAVAPASGISGGRRGVKQVGVEAELTKVGERRVVESTPTKAKLAREASAGKPPTGEQQKVKRTGERLATEKSVGEPTTGEKSAVTPTLVQQDDEGSESGDDEGELSDDEKSTNSDVLEVQPGPWRSGRRRGPPERLTYHVCLPLATFTTVYDDDDLPELDPDMHADPEHRWDITTMTVKEALASWKGKLPIL
ncbi:unnamed protein product [Closterium sp. NIES-53]